MDPGTERKPTMALTTHNCPHCHQSFEVESGTGVTASIRTFARQYKASHPNAKASEVAKAYMKTNPEANMYTVMTQVRGV